MKDENGKSVLEKRHLDKLQDLDFMRNQLLQIIEPRAKLFIGNEWPDVISIVDNQVYIKYWFAGGPEDLYIPIDIFLECDTKEKVKAYYKACNEARIAEEEKASEEREAKEDEAELDRLRKKYPDKFK